MMAEKLIKIPYELQLALKTIVNSENQELVFILYYHKKLRWEEIKEKATVSSFEEASLRECIDGLWVTGFYEGGWEDHHKFYELTPFGRRLLEAMLNVLYLKEAS